tara:strand:- start:28767 stop:29366 length:600 start_codon:yes stop_codon:yes gene_type:complete
MPVNIHGNDYYTVAERMVEFNKHCPNGSIRTEILCSPDVIHNCKRWVVKAIIVMDMEEMPDMEFTAHAEEVVGSSNINRASALENCETSAIGRALGFAGFLNDGGGIPTAEDIQTHQLQVADTLTAPQKRKLDTMSRSKAFTDAQTKKIKQFIESNPLRVDADDKIKALQPKIDEYEAKRKEEAPAAIAKAVEKMNQGG